jgi:hypothetical protein
MTEYTPINPLLQASLPQMIERLGKAKREVGDILRPIAVDANALSDFLDFEVTRAELELSKAEWSSRADIEAIRDRVRYLTDLKAGVEESSVSEMLKNLEWLMVALVQLSDEAG